MVPPSVESFSKRVQDDSAALWIELTKIDLEHRLRNELTIVSDEYEDRRGQLTSIEQREDILQYEFEIRQKFDQRPTDSELITRFGDGNLAVKRLLPEDIPSAQNTVGSESDESVDGSNVTDIASILVSGTMVNQYSIDRQIGAGAFAVIYVANDENLGRPVALKFLRPLTSQLGNVRERMLREAQAVAGLRHANIVPIFETGRFRNHDFIVSQYIAGQDLECVLAAREFEVGESVELIRQLALAVHHAHQNGVVHRDIKPANIMLDGCGNPMLLDFGLAHLGDASIQLTHAGDVVGTPAYMPPEQADGRAWQADRRSDVYSLGAILFQLVCGRLPFVGTTPVVIQNVIHQPVPSPCRIKPGIDRDLQTIILKCLEKEPSDRYQTGDALAEDLARYAQGESIIARPAGRVGRALKWSKRRPGLASLMASLLLALSFLIGISTQLKSVKTERDRAVRAEKKSRLAEIELEQRLATEAAAAGRLAMQRGRLSQAILFFENSLNHGYGDPLDLHLLKLSSYVATRQKEKAYNELQLIVKTMDPSSRKGDVLIWTAELALDGYTNLGDPVELFELALQEELDDASRDYVQAMLSKTSIESLTYFQSGLAYDHFHHRARRMLIIMLISLGRMADAETEVKIAIELFPEDCDFQLFKALLSAHQGRIDASEEILDRAELSVDDRERWQVFCQLVDQVSNKYVIFPGNARYREEAILELAEEFSRTCIPIIRQQGWHFPPRIGVEIEQLPDILSKRADLTTIQDTIARLRGVVQIHPEGSLYSILSERLVTYQNLIRENNSDVFKSVDPQLIIESLQTIEQALQLPAIVRSAHDTTWNSIYANAISLALIYEIDVEENSRRAIEAAREIDERQINHADGLKGLTVGLLNLKEYDDAERFATAWVERTQHRDFDALWHRLMCDRFRQRWYDVMVRCNELIVQFPDREDLKGLRGAAKQHLESATESGK